MKELMIDVWEIASELVSDYWYIIVLLSLFAIGIGFAEIENSLRSVK